MKLIAVGFLSALASALLPGPCRADMLPSPFEIELNTTEGIMVGFERGTIENHHYEDKAGYTFKYNSTTKDCFYCTKDEEGDLAVTACRCLKCNPSTQNFDKHLKESAKVATEKCGCFCKKPNQEELNPVMKAMKAKKLNARARDDIAAGDRDERKLSVQTVLKNLVIMVRFSDHKERSLPDLSLIDKLMNNDGPDSVACPTGSIKDVYKFNSYGDLIVESHVTDWIDVPQTEAYYGDGRYGMNGQLSEALIHALRQVDESPTLSISDFDADNDGKIDAVTFLHSGYGAEWGGAGSEDRIWSHKWRLSSGGSTFTSSGGIYINDYHISPAIWGTSGTAIGRIGVIAHELGHFLGLPDLYDGGGGDGVGSYCLMGNSWGFDGSQYYPPMMSPWTKIELGWLEPSVITSSSVAATYTLEASHSNEDVYKIEEGFAPGEYLLIENRQHSSSGSGGYKFEDKVKQEGIVIYHIDEDASDVIEGHPGQSGWPENGNHYRVSILAADGNYDLEEGNNRGDEGDVFYASGVNEIGPFGVGPSSSRKPYPNTDAYGDGVFPSNHYIFDISEPGPSMTFKLMKDLSTVEPTASPTRSPVQAGVSSLETTFAGGNGKAGNMFDLVAKTDLEITELAIHSTATDAITCYIYTRPETHVGYQSDSSEWDQIGAIHTIGNGLGSHTVVAGFPPISMSAGERKAFYVVLDSNNMEYTNGDSTMFGQVIYSNSDLDFYQGSGNSMAFGANYQNRIFNGKITYNTGTGSVPTNSPSKAPVRVPTLAPVTVPSPTRYPTRTPSRSPSKKPTIQESDPQEITTTYAGGNGSYGNFFDVMAFQEIEIRSFDIHTHMTYAVTVKVYAKDGTYGGFEKVASAWGNPICEGTVTGQGQNNPTPIPESMCTPIRMSASEIKGFHITLTVSGIRYTNGYSEGSVYAENSDLAIMEGKGARFFLNRNYSRRIWNGTIRYVRFGAAGSPSQTVYPTGGGLQFSSGEEEQPWDGDTGSVCGVDEDDQEEEECEKDGEACVNQRCSAVDTVTEDGEEEESEASEEGEEEEDECSGQGEGCKKGSDCCTVERLVCDKKEKICVKKGDNVADNKKKKGKKRTRKLVTPLPPPA